MKTFASIVRKYRTGEAKYSKVHKYIKSTCVSLELDLAISMKRIEKAKKEAGP